VAVGLVCELADALVVLWVGDWAVAVEMLMVVEKDYSVVVLLESYMAELKGKI